LHSHELPSPITEQQEVSCFGDDENSDENDIWVVLQYDEDSEIYEDNVSIFFSENRVFVTKVFIFKFWHVDQPVIIRHVQTGKLLHSHEEALADGENEVTGYDENDDNSRWAAVSC
jgi:dolichyl-phosphate-mannose--protein O-mannosyl transferase